ncbi:hypothetical protein SAMN05443575_1419 [Jatrophihabitans endophyticus]|uniref:histidine kinase n=1 Tax=Jatrophihabitans endophyticus TaxID=1206085 RepID=A0A1M5H7A9_9ACTN|nr:hypothetical protein SAMN05443575_1419 [Jatrophihabitans endophyticus]
MPDGPAAGEIRGRSRDWTLRGRLGKAFGAVCAVMLVLILAVVVSALLFVRAGNDVIDRWQPALTTSARLLTDLVDQETGLRGYALTRDPQFLEPYRRHANDETRDRSQLSSLIAEDEGIRRRWDDLRAATERWRAEIAEPAVARIADDPAAGVAIVGSAGAKARFDAIRSRAAALDVVLRTRVADARSERVRDGVLFGVSGALLVVVLVGSGLVLWRGLARWVLTPVETLAGQTRSVARGDMHRRIVPVGPHELTSLAEDVEAMRLRIATELGRAEAIGAELRARGEELARSNDDLQQFAYVASHDLSEPLRKVANFCQLLERQYGPQLDDRARQYIHFAVDGAKRMQVLITDLLALSRVGRGTEGFERIDLDVKLDQAIANLGDKFTEAGAVVERLTPLPTVDGDRALLVSLLENLVGNAVKYRREDVAPVVRVSAEVDPDTRVWTITVSDNGIGIDAEYAERIFAVFQRLHLRDQYGGTGIGLALCRKIVEFHGGRIWLAAVESADTASSGATFRFTLPEVRNAKLGDGATALVAGRPAGRGRPG